MIWDWVFYAAVTLFVYTQIPKPEGAKPPGLNEIDVPTVDPSRDIPVIFGTVDIRSPNTVWYGDLRTKSIKS